MVISALVNIREQIFIMELIEHLGVQKYISPRTGNISKESVGLFKCPICKKSDILRPVSNGKKAKTCGKGCKDNGCYQHGKCDTRIYSIWGKMVQRCTNPKNPVYPYYGGKGIKVCDKWLKFENFYQDMSFTYRDDLTIDRKDSTKGYFKENCQWLTMNENRIKDQIKKISKYSKKGKLIIIYDSAAEAARKENKGLSNINRLRAIANSFTRVARGERKSYKGFVWKYL